MAERRMFAKSIVMSDAFLDMPLSSRCLYFTLGICADDEGFIGNPKSIMRQCGADQNDLDILMQKRYVLGFPSGVIVIKHWRMNNYLRTDRIRSTTYIEEKDTLTIDKRGAYTEVNKVGIPHDNQVSTKCQPSDNHMSEIGIPSIGKYSIDKNNNILSDRSDDVPVSFTDDIKQVIDYLNTKLGTHYTIRGKSNVKLIRARLQEGHTVEEFKTVIDKKYAEWGNDPKMSKYLRPETLFCGGHFESYLNEVETKPAPASSTTMQKIHNFNERDYDFDELERIAKGV